MLTASPGEYDGERTSGFGQDVNDVEPHSIVATIDPPAEKPSTTSERAGPNGEPVTDRLVAPGAALEGD
jgi:hypothetical protein